MLRLTRDGVLPEGELLLLAATDDGAERTREILRGPFNWPELVASAERCRAHRAVWQLLVGAGLDQVPAEHRDRLQRLAQIATFRQACLEGALRDSLRILDAAGLEVLLLKGAALAVAVYGSFAERPMADLDLLLRGPEAAAGEQLLLEAGWRPTSLLPLEEQQALYRDHHHRTPLTDGRATGVVLEIHSEPLPRAHPFRFDGDALWRSAGTVRVGEGAVRVPDPHLQLLHLALHFAWAHGLERGAWRTLRDIRVLSALPAINWDQLVEMARWSGGGSCLYWTLRLGRTLVSAPVPEGVLDALASPGSPRRRDLVERHLAATLFGGVRCPSRRVARAIWEAAIAPEANGHRGARPWLRQQAFTRAGVPGVDDGLGWKNVTEWRRYLHALRPWAVERSPGARAGVSG